jgi:hypothetical protein
MTYTYTSRKIEVSSCSLPEILSLLNQSKRPLILTTEGQGVAAIIPYVDPKECNKKRKQKLNVYGCEK